jgi:hypothetical protein
MLCHQYADENQSGLRGFKFAEVFYLEEQMKMISVGIRNTKNLLFK